jgi:nucleotide-binding universal stress UspA family protein
MKTNHVLCPIDGSEASARALVVAADAAAALQIPLRVFSAVEDPHEIAQQRAQVDFSVAEIAADIEIDVDVTAAPHAPKAIVAFAGDDALVVMATTTRLHVLSGYFGSATEHVIRTLHRPVVTVGPRCEHSLADITGVVVPCDGSALSEEAVPVAKAWADELGVELTVVSVLESRTAAEGTGPTNYVHNIAKRFDAQWEVLHGADPAKDIAGHAGNRLIVMTSHGRSGFNRLRLGSVATETSRWAKAPVVIVNPAKADASVDVTEVEEPQPAGT